MKKNKKKDKNRISGFTMYRKTLIFNFPRIPFTILGFFIGGAIPFLLQKIFTGGEPSAIVTTVGGLLGVFLYKQITNFGKYQYQTAQIAIITHAIKRNVMHQQPFRTGMKLLRLNYETESIIGFAMIIMQGAAMHFLGKERFIDAIRTKGGDMKAYIRSLSVMMLTNMLPYCGYCATSWDFAHPEEYMLESICNGTEAFLKNAGKMLLRLSGIILLRAIQMVITFSITMLVFIVRIEWDMEYVNLIYEWSRYNGMTYDGSVSVLMQVMVILSVGVVLLVNLFFQPIDIIRLLRKFYEITQDRPPVGVIYNKFEKKLDQVSDKRRRRTFEERLLNEHQKYIHKEESP